MQAWWLWTTNLKKNCSLSRKDIRVAWTWPSLARGSRWHQVLGEFTKHFPNTVLFTGIWPGFARGLEGTFKVQQLGGVRIFCLGRTKMGVPKAVTWVPPSALLRLIRFRPDVLLTNGFGLCTAYALIVKVLMGSRVVLLWQGISSDTGGEHGSFRLWVRQMMAPFFDLTICNTREGVEYLRNMVGIPAAKLWRYVYEVGESDALFTQESKEVVLPSMDRRPVFLYVGRLIQAKGVHKLLEASSLLVERGLKQFSVMIVGDGDQKRELCQLAHALGLEDQVSWNGFIPHEELGPYYKACDVFVLPSLDDTWGVVVPEAMAFGKPVCCSRCAGVSEIVRHGVNGFVFDPYKPEELADYMERFIREPGLIEEQGAASKKIIVQHQYPKVASVLADVVTRILDFQTVNLASLGQQSASADTVLQKPVDF